MGFEDTLAEYGLNTMQASFSVCIIILLTLFFFSSGSSGTDNGIDDEIELHPEHVKYMKKKEEEHCSSSFGKGLRCIIDYLREEDDKAVKKIFAEKPKYTEGFERYEISIHPPQFEWLEEKGIKVGSEKGEEYKVIHVFYVLPSVPVPSIFFSFSMCMCNVCWSILSCPRNHQSLMDFHPHHEFCLCVCNLLLIIKILNEIFFI